MKRILMFLAITAGMASVSAAQEVYNEVRNSAQTAVRTTGNSLVKQINQFKLDALDYLLIKMREQLPDSTTAFLDKQAFALNNFIAFYLQQMVDIGALPKTQQVKILQLFMDASVSNPLFNDPDHELTQGYYADSKCLTRFSLDTDWRRAYAAVVAETARIRK